MTTEPAEKTKQTINAALSGIRGWALEEGQLTTLIVIMGFVWQSFRQELLKRKGS